MPNATPLPRLSAKLRSLFNGEPPTYRRLYNLAADGVLPTELRNGRIFVLDADLPRVAALVGLTIPADRVAA